jgi:hypothetical protein
VRGLALAVAAFFLLRGGRYLWRVCRSAAEPLARPAPNELLLLTGAWD